jgi:hypothetical protein
MSNWHLRALFVCGLILIVFSTISHQNSATSAEAASVTCTQIVGFSQTMQWYFAGFQTTISNTKSWELRWVGGGSIGNWADPNYVGWTDDAYQATTCSSNWNSPDQALLDVSGDYSNDPNYWAQQTQLAMTNLRNKWPTVRRIILQPVVGGPGGGLCIFSGSVVRASYNFPFIIQGLQQLANGSTVVLGITPTVTSCSDYADNIGHLTDSAKGPIGVMIGSYYNSFSSASVPPPPPTNTPTPAPTSGPSATPVPTVSAGSTRTITFDDLSNPGRPLSGQYPSGVIDWGTSNWFLSGPYGLFTTNSIGFNGSGPTSETFTYLTPTRTIQLDAFNGGSTSTTVTLSCDGTQADQMTLSPGQLQTIPMGWIGTCTHVTIASTNGWATNFDNIVIDTTPPATAAPTNTPTAVPTNTPTAVPTNTPTAVPTNTPTAAPTNTPTAVPTNTPTAAPTNTPTAVPTSSTLGAAAGFTVTFDDISGKNHPLNGQYPSGLIDWGTNNWYLSGPYGAFTTKSVGFNGPGPTSERFTLLTPVRLVQLDAYNGVNAASNVSLACPGQNTIQVTLKARQLQTISTGWTTACPSITIGSSNGWKVNFDNMVFASPLSVASSGLLVNFNDLSNPNRPLNGQYPTNVIDWGTNAWYLSGPFGPFTTNSVGFNGSSFNSGTLTFVSPRRLVQVDAYNGGKTTTTVTLSCAGQPTVSVGLSPGQQLTIATGWTGQCSKVTITSSNGWATNFDNFNLQ